MNPADASPRRSLAPIVGVAFGVPMLAFGLWTAFQQRHDTHPFELLRWVIASDLAHDLLAAPVIVTVAWLVGRLSPAAVRAPLRWALATSGVLLLIAWPFVRGYGRDPSIPSLLGRDYWAGLLAYLGVTWFLAAVWIGATVGRHRRREV
jgi:hypothetical protein